MHLSGCEGKMRVTLPKTKKDADSDSSDANDSYQQGYVPGGNGDGNYGNEDGDNGDNGKRHRRMALGCLFFIVVAAAAAVAFFALNHTTKQPIEDPYENVEPDTTSVDTIPEDTEDVVVDTVQVHEEKPKEEAAPKDTATVVATPDDGDGADVSQQSSDASSDVTEVFRQGPSWQCSRTIGKRGQDVKVNEEVEYPIVRIQRVKQRT